MAQVTRVVKEDPHPLLGYDAMKTVGRPGAAVYLVRKESKKHQQT